ncbi:nephrin isoform X2 [Denticeps clupeoides]|uniref:nephrin isoform X2 n=1 Tax=Denticeps clupeoides TaxID=299321 RepID=UPI0010A2CE3F|nr:nephrin isoform X2 [Denticeps clupeoides]
MCCSSLLFSGAFRTQPRNTTVREGANVVLKCEVLRVTGVVQWAKDGLLLGPHRSLPGYPRYSITGEQRRGQYHLMIEKATLGDDSPYECQVGPSETSQAIISRTAWIDVQIPPSQPYIEFETLEPWVAGKVYTVTCTAPDAKPAAEITLFKDGVELTDADSFTMSGSEDKLLNTQAEVRVMALSSDNGRQVACRAKNPALPGAIVSSKTMTVYFPPHPPVIIGLESEEVKAGTVLKLKCLSNGGNPLPMMHWKKNGEFLSRDWEEDIISWKAESILTMEVTPEDNHAVLECGSGNQVTPKPLAIRQTLTVFFEPSEVTVLGSFRVIEGQTLSLSCYTSSSNPPVQIRWWLGFKELNSTNVTMSDGEHGGMATMSNLTHTVSREENGLPLSCETFNKGTRFSSMKTNNLIVFYPPQKVWLDVPSEGIQLRSKTTVRLVCYSSGGSSTGSLTWLKNGKVVSHASRQVTSQRGVSRELSLVLQPSDNMAVYRCDATNEAKKALSAQTRLHVLFPAITVKISVKQETLRTGETAILECLCGSSNPKADIRWSLGSERLNGVDQASKKAEHGGVAFSSKLSLRLLFSHHGQKVTCQAFSPVLSEGVNSFYTLSVLFPPEFAPAQPELVGVVEDDEVTMPLMVSGNPDVSDCDWTFRGEKLVKERDPRYGWDEGFAMTIRNVTRRDGGKYAVDCTNEEGQSRVIITLDVSFAPSVRMKTDPVYVDVGGTADLLCVADANPIIPGMFSWKWLGEGEADLSSQNEDGDTGWLTLFEVTRSHAGWYQCTADNGIAPPATVEGQLIVQFKPQLKKGPQWSKVASRGDGVSKAEVVCQAEGVPKVHFTWAKNGAMMDLNNPRYLEQTVTEGVLHTSTLTILNVSALLDYATFTCTGRNSQGEDALDVQLLSTNRPDPPSDFRLVGVTHNSATLEWMPGFDGGLTQKFRVRYYWEGSTSYQYVDVFPPKATSFRVTSLLPATTYNFSVNALNNMGESSYADNNAVVTATTEKDPAAGEDPPTDDDSAPKGLYGLPIYLTVVLAVAGVALLFGFNSLGFFLFIKRTKGRSLAEGTGSGSAGKKSDGEGSTVSGSNRYASADQLINAMAQRTLLIESASETESSAYEAYGAESSHYYLPTEDFQPSLYTHLESLEGRYPVEPVGHEYEEVQDWRLHQDMVKFPLSPVSPRSAFPDQWRRRQVAASSSQDQRVDLKHGSTNYQRIETRLPDIPFELRGELV